MDGMGECRRPPWGVGSRRRRAFLVAAFSTAVLAALIGVGSYALAGGFAETIGTWANLHATGSLPRSSPNPGTYDPSAHQAVWYYGRDSFDPRQTWVYDVAGNTFRQLPATGPLPEIIASSLSYNGVTGSVIGFGINGSVDGTPGPQTWVYDRPSSSWNEVRPAVSAPGVSYPCMAFDPELGKVVLFEGYNGDRLLGRSWAYDSGANTWVDLRAGGSPHIAGGAALVYDEKAGRLLLFGGMLAGDADATSSNETWAYDPQGNRWINLKPAVSPTARSGGILAFDRSSGKVIMFGGLGTMSPFGDTWAYDPNSNTWADLNPSGTVPEARGGHSMVYDPATDKTILFAGSNGKHGGDLNDTWQYDASTNKWTNLHPAGGLPAARDSFSFAYDSSRSRVVIYGGYDGSGFLNDTWAYSLQTNTWTDLKPTAASPSALQGQSMIYDPSSHEVIMFGGYDGTKSLNQTWTVH